MRTLTLITAIILLSCSKDPIQETIITPPTTLEDNTWLVYDWYILQERHFNSDSIMNSIIPFVFDTIHIHNSNTLTYHNVLQSYTYTNNTIVSDSCNYYIYDTDKTNYINVDVLTGSTMIGYTYMRYTLNK